MSLEDSWEQKHSFLVDSKLNKEINYYNLHDNIEHEQYYYPWKSVQEYHPCFQACKLSHLFYVILHLQLHLHLMEKVRRLELKSVQNLTKLNLTFQSIHHVIFIERGDSKRENLFACICPMMIDYGCI